MASNEGFETLGSVAEPRLLYPDGARSPKEDKRVF